MRRWAVSVLVMAMGCGPGASEEPLGWAGSTTASASASEAATAPEAEAAAQEESEAEPASEAGPEASGASRAAEENEGEVALAALLAMTGEESTSIGGPRDGRLEGGVALPEWAPGLQSGTPRPNPEAVYGTVEMVQALVQAAAVVHEALPGSALRISDLGFREGGPIPHHGSHRAGRDVDVLFYLVDRDDAPIPSVGAFLDPRGVGVDFRDLSVREDDVVVRLDAPRTWRFVQALLEGPRGDDVQRIFVAEHLRALLLAQAERARAGRATRERFAQITCQPGAPHDDHLHIRFHCSIEDLARGCADSPPVYPWRRAALRDAGLRPTLNRPRPDRPQAPQTSPEEARAAAGELHPRVERWLTRREAWLEPPHPGRPFCR